MEYIRHNTNFQLKNTAVALGKFDGLHRGHQILLDEIISQKKNGLKAAVFTFDTPPVKVVHGTNDGMIMTGAERKQHLLDMGLDILIEYPFTYDFSRMEPVLFVEKILIEQLDMKFLAVGEDFHFGKNQSGDVALLASLSETYGFTFSVHQKLKAQETDIISSTLIKRYIREGKLEAANKLMGHPYTISGTVIAGRQLGRKLSYPTANVAVPDEKVLPPFGVYAVSFLLDDKSYKGIANLGKKPTVQQRGDIGLETFIFDFQGDLYQKNVQVQLLKFIRKEQQFDSVEALSGQIAQDVLEARTYLSDRS